MTTPTHGLVKERFKKFFEDQFANVEWNWDDQRKAETARVLVEAVFDLDDLIRCLMEPAL